jgi:hypothetical protein
MQEIGRKTRNTVKGKKVIQMAQLSKQYGIRAGSMVTELL